MSSLGNIKLNFTDSLIREIRVNSRLVRLIWLVGYLVALYAIVALHDESNRLRETTAVLIKRTERVLAAGEVETWDVRYRHELMVSEQLLAYCWSSSSAELASADMQTVLQRLALDNEIGKVRLVIGEPETEKFDDKSVWLIRAQLQGRSERENLPFFVKALEKSGEFFSIEGVTYFEQRGGSMTLLLQACFVDESSL